MDFREGTRPRRAVVATSRAQDASALVEILGCEGIDATLADPAEPLPAQIARTPPEVLVLDEDLAERALLEELRARFADLCIVLLAGRVPDDPRLRAATALVDSVVAKPISIARLAAVVRDTAT